MQKRRVLINAIVSVVQVVVNGLLLFVLYRFLYDTVGAAGIGVWATVMAWTSMSGLANLGLSGSAVKFVSMYLARGDRAYVRDVVQTSILSIAGALLLVLPLAYPLLGWLVDAFIEPPSLAPVARDIVPYALASFWLTTTATVVGSCIDGFQRVDLRNGLLMGSAIVYLGFVFLLVPERGLTGLVQAQVLQGAGLLVAYWVVVRRLVRGLPLLPVRWSGRAFREMLRYSVGLQAISFSALLFVPVTQTLVTYVGGAGAAGFFDMANRMVVQLRALVVTAHGALVPTIADLQERDPARLEAVYATSFRLVLFLVVPALPLLVALTPVIGRIWLGTDEPLFALFGSLLFAGWFLNMLGNPAYFANVGTGRLRPNVVGQALVGGANVSLGVLLGWLAGAPGVVAALAVALLVGSTYVATEYVRTHRIRVRDLVGPGTLVLTLAGGAGFSGLWVVRRLAEPTWPPLLLGMLLVLLYSAVVAVPLWRHPARVQVQGWLLTLLPFRREAPHANP